ncbi:glycoside hydrolase family 5 protein [Xanthomonas fragariae]|uniref:Endoglucanase n=2 Tax=Xanthomonas fragariae TaxID=48664 RepID=A0A1Y6H228_9XANT|nr:glycoside hydrolase family 5 protein [Xanthomonas fragariae]AOD16350.1 cellulase [Xanthomonas fragariae]AOD19782.1 cellulase [Xanthomonas fragariae]ENZ96576.1 cellulase [Xanthomonas fragariae LMG 25863]MBL9196968.1 glycoside hydrolase family 5 protein [Xanthomonas fragariae]MBL9221921.1 glycoside hydrolase family 5 protein [Xanthomonas fragariae]
MLSITTRTRQLRSRALSLFLLAIVPFTHAQSANVLKYAGVNLSGAENKSSKKNATVNIDYVFPAASDYTYFAGKHMNTIRLPIPWERVQPKAGGELDPAQLALIRQAVANAKAAKMHLILDMHNYSKYYGNTIGSKKVPISTFTDLWRRLAIEFKSDNTVIFGLMNEPCNITPQSWAAAAQASINTIRKTGANNLILVPGALWTGAHSWYSTNAGQSNAVALASIYDPVNHYAIEAHQYMDNDSSGTSVGCVSATIGAERLNNFTKWLRLNKKHGFLGEFGTGNNVKCNGALNSMLKYIESNSDVWLGWTYWAAGAWWNRTYQFNVHPDAQGRDKPQMSILSPRARRITDLNHTPDGD